MLVSALPAGAQAEQASESTSPAAARLDAGRYHTCALLDGGKVRCWGFNGNGQLGNGSTNPIGDDETPQSVAPVELGPERTATAITAGLYHTCALLNGGKVRCWGFGADGRLGYGNTNSVGDDETPASVGPVDLGPGRTATAISAGGGHTCAVLDNGHVRCWGHAGSGQLGYGNVTNVGDDETPGSAGPVNLGTGRTATAITAGANHTCALLDNDSVLCWGNDGNGPLGYGHTDMRNIGDDEAPASVGPVNLGEERTAKAISGGTRHTCAVLDNGTVRCWGFGANGRLGYGNVASVGTSETPNTVGPVDLGAGRTANAISAGDAHTCARLDDGSVRCWGYGGDGRLGYGNQNSIGDSEPPGSVGPVQLGATRTAVAISAGGAHTCVRLDDGAVRCWGNAADGRVGYCNQNSIGDDETPDSAGPVGLETPGSGCPRAGGEGTATAPSTGGAQSGGGDGVGPLPGLSPAPGARRAPSRRPGRVIDLRARATSETKIKLTFRAAGTNGSRPPPARSYLVRQSRRPIRSARDFARAQTLCNGRCRFPVSSVSARIVLTITDLRPRTTYYYAVAARDNASMKLGSRSKTVRARTR